jgi:hypothetical protein
VRPGQTQFPTYLQAPSKEKSNRLKPYLQAAPGAEDCKLSIPAIKCARGCLHLGSNPPTLKDMHVADCTRSQTRAIIFLQPYRYFVSIADAHETTQTSSLPPDEADSSVIFCTDTAHPLTSFAPTNPANLSKYDDPCDVNANEQRANDRWDDQPLILDRKRNTGYCVLQRQYRSKLRARKRLCGVTPTPPIPKAGCYSAAAADTVKLPWGGAIKPPVIKSCERTMM